MNKSKMVVGVLCVLLAVTILTGCPDVNQAIENIFDGSGNLDMDKVTSVIGKSYDMTGTYADTTQQDMRSVLDPDLIASANLLKRDKNVERSVIDYQSGDTFETLQESYQRNILVTAGASMPGVFSFSTEITNNFGTEKTKSVNYSAVTAKSNVIKAAFYIDGFQSFANPNYTDERLKKILAARSSEFLAAVAGVTDAGSAELFVSNWGTSVLLGGYWGARAEFSRSAYKKAISNTETLLNKVKTDLAGTIKGVDVNVGNVTEINQKFAEQFESSTLSKITVVRGGDSQFAQNINDAGNYDNWLASINDSTIVWSDYYPKSVAFIYDLIEDETKRNLVKDAVLAYYNSKKLTLTDQPLPQLKTGTATNDMDIKGLLYDWLKITNGDSEIGSQATLRTYYKIKVKFSQDSGDNRIRLDAEMRIQEDKSDYSTFEGHLTYYFYPIVFGKAVSLVELKADNLEFTSNQTNNGGKGDYFTHGIADKWLDIGDTSFGHLWVMLDASGREDNKNCGFRFKLNIPITYYEQ